MSRRKEGRPPSLPGWICWKRERDLPCSDETIERGKTAFPPSNAPPKTFLSLRHLVPRHHAPFHHETDLLQLADVFQRIAGNRDQVGVLSRLQAAHPLLPAEELGGVEG